MPIAQNAVWSPTGTHIRPDFYERECKELLEKFEKYRRNPNLPRRYLFFFALPVAAEIIFFILAPRILSGILQMQNGIFVPILPAIPLLIYVRHIRKLQTDLVKLMIARENKWIYSPRESPSDWSPLANRFPEIFLIGGGYQNMQDEFWGTVQAISFYSGVFEYSVKGKNIQRRYGARNWEYTKTETPQMEDNFARKFNYHMKSKNYKTVFALQLNKTLQTDFRLEPEGIVNKFLNIFRSGEIDTESAEFNKTFAVFYRGQKIEQELEIVKTLSPAVQIKLLELKKRRGGFTILFRDDTVIIAFDGNMFRHMHSNFFKKVELDPRDHDFMQTTIREVLDISTQIIPYLN